MSCADNKKKIDNRLEKQNYLMTRDFEEIKKTKNF